MRKPLLGTALNCDFMFYISQAEILQALPKILIFEKLIRRNVPLHSDWGVYAPETLHLTHDWHNQYRNLNRRKSAGSKALFEARCTTPIPSLFRFQNIRNFLSLWESPKAPIRGG